MKIFDQREFCAQDHPTVLHLLPDSEGGYFKITFIMCGIIAAVLISTIALFFAKRQTKVKEKLNGIPREKDLNKNHHQVGTELKTLISLRVI